MGFYGHITNVQKTTMTFDRIYSSRTAMDAAVSNDGVYAGRYVLVEYNNALDPTLLPGVVQFDGMLYPPPPARLPSSWKDDDNDPTSPTSYLTKLNPLTVKADLTEDMAEGFIKPKTIVICSSDFNLGVVQNEQGDKSILPWGKKQYFEISDSDTTKMSYNLLYNYKDQKFQLDSSSSKESKTGCSYSEINYSAVSTDPDSADANYLLNFNLDVNNYNAARGYDSTVWQKTYASGKPKYVMIAELNSVVPILDVSADAPTLAPVMPHFDKDSTNIYYKLHMQPSWGFRVRAANHNLTVPTLDYSGSQIVANTQGAADIQAGSHIESYPSDEKVNWINTIYDEKSDNYINQYLAVGQDGKGSWGTLEDNTGVDGAIYYNKAGFIKERSNHSKDLDRTSPIHDEITLTPSGYSGHLYPTHKTDGENKEKPDVNELTVMLPSIGDTVADMWDLMYGNAEINGSPERNLIIRWEDAKQVLAKEGLRLVELSDNSYGQTYQPEEVNTLAGAINSVQDILGMIITKDYPDDVDNWNENYIYYDTASGKYYYKKRTYEYEPIDKDVAYEKVDLVDWNTQKANTWWIDTNSTTPDYMQEQTFRPERRYVSGVNVPTDPSKARHFTTGSYAPGAYFLYTNKNESGNELLDDKTKAPYHKYYVSHEKYDTTHHYYDIKATPKTLPKNVAYYIPNKYYAGYFTEIEIENEQDFERKIKNGVRLFLSAVSSNIYGISVIEQELKTGEYSKISQRPVYYLTLKTCSLTEQQYNNATGANKPILFTSTFQPNGDGAQNYYVISRKYELFEDKITIANSPGVYYQLKIGEGVNVSDYLTDGKILKSEYEVNLRKDEDVVVDEGYAYFREVVELILSSAENVVDIANAKVIEVDKLPENLYMWDAQDESYKSISALSKEITSAKDYSTIKNLFELEISDLAIGYIPNKYYYQIEDGDFANSVIIDNKLKPTPGRNYYTANMINKRKLTADEIKGGRVNGIIYYTYNSKTNEYIEHGGSLVTNGTYYISSLVDAPEIYYPHKYYYREANGEFVLDTTPTFTAGREYYRNPQLYVLDDPNKFYAKGSLWPLATNPPENSGIVLATRKDAWEKSELKGFDIDFNTLHGVLLRLNQWMKQGDALTRDEDTLQGALNKLNDLIRRFGTMEPGELMMVDNAGRMAGVTYTTKQDFTAVNHGGQGVKVTSTNADPDGEDRWIDFDTITDYTKPKIVIKHNFTKVEDTTSSTDMNNPAVNSIQLYAPIVDSTGHVVGKNIETVQLPFGFKTIKATNNTTEALTQDKLATNSDIVADHTQDTLSLAAGNKWIEFTTNANSDQITISHKARNDIGQSEAETIMDNQTGDARNEFSMIDDVECDPAGHVISRSYRTYKLPNSYQIFTDSKSNKSTAQNAYDTFTIKGDTWLIPTVAQGSVTYVHKAEDAETSTLDTIVMDDANDKNVFGPVVSDFDWDDAGHITTKKFISYKLPNSYQTFAVSADEKTVATNAYDTLTIAGDDWMKPVIEQGTLKYTHINQKISEGFTALGAHALGAQTPQFGETFNAQVYTLDANGHIVGKSTETVQIPTDIKGLLLTSYNAENSKYLTADITLEAALAALDSAIAGVQQTVDNNQDAYETASESLRNELDNYYSSMEDEHELIRSEMTEANEAILDALDDVHAEINEALKEKNESDAITYAPIEGNINEETSFIYQEAADDLPEVRLTVAEVVTKLSELDSEVIKSNQKFVYTPAVEEVSHEATQEEVDAGLATALGEKIIDVEAVPAEELTIADLFMKVKQIEQMLINLT